MSTPKTVPAVGRLFHRPFDTGPAFWGPGDRYTFLVTGEESGGAVLKLGQLAEVSRQVLLLESYGALG